MKKFTTINKMKEALANLVSLGITLQYLGEDMTEDDIENGLAEKDIIEYHDRYYSALLKERIDSIHEIIEIDDIEYKN